MSDDTLTVDRRELIKRARSIYMNTEGAEIAKRAAALHDLETKHPEMPREAAEQIAVEAAESGGRRVSAIGADEIEAEHTVWLWDRWIPYRGITILLGEEGLGKSHVTIEKAAEATFGELPGDSAGEPQTVLFVTIEDDPASVIVPRLMAARGGRGANLSRIKFVTVEVDGAEGGLSLPGDAEALAKLAAEVGARLIVIDPLTTFLEGKIDTHKESDVKQALAPLQRIAERDDLAIWGVHHPNKSGATNEREASSASGAFRTAPRASMVFGLDPDDATGEDGESRILAHGKHNHSQAQKAWRVKVETAFVENGKGEQIETSRAVFGERCEHKVADVLGARARFDAKPKAADAVKFLKTYLGESARVKEDVISASKAAGIKWATLKRAAAEVGVVKDPTAEKPPRSIWRLPMGDEGARLGMD